MERYRGVTASPAARGRPERMMNPTQPDWQAALTTWLAPFLDHLGHKARRRMCPLYVAGLIAPGERKSIEPIATRLAPADYDQLHHFVCDGLWDPAPLEAELLAKADQLLGGTQAVLVIDDTALPKKGSHSVGVAHQYAGVLGKKANCQVLVSLTLARDEVPLPIALRLFLPESWTSEPARLQRAGGLWRASFQARDRALRARPGAPSGCSLRRRCGGRKLRDQRRLSPGALGTRPGVGGRDPAHAEGLPGRCRTDLAGAKAPRPAGLPRAGGTLHRGPGALCPGAVAHTQLAAGLQGAAQGRLRGHTRARGGRAGRTPARARQAAPSGRGGMAGGRAPRIG